MLASSNAGKLREFKDMLARRGLEVVGQSSLGVQAPEETGLTFLENALLKARHAARETGLPAIADDSGLVVDALRGAPGVRSARYAGESASDADNVRKLLSDLASVPPGSRRARFVCLAVFLHSPEDSLPAVAQGEWKGSIATAPRGRGGFGYDPVFEVPGRGCTAAELAARDKNAISHRARALRELMQRLGDSFPA